MREVIERAKTDPDLKLSQVMNTFSFTCLMKIFIEMGITKSDEK